MLKEDMENYTNEMNSRQSINISNIQNLSVDMGNITRPVQPTAPKYIVYTATMFYIIIFVVGIVGNIVVVAVIVLSKSMKTSINMYLLNLCVADLLVMIVCMPTALAEIFTMEAWLFGEAMCKLVPFLENTVANASILTIFAISIERYRVVKHPLSGIEEDFRKVRIILVIIWIIAVASSAPWIPIAVYRSSQLVDGTPIMVCRNPIRLSWQRIYVVLLAVVFFLLPCSTLFVLYCRLCLILHHAKSYHSRDDSSSRMLSYKDRRRLRGQVFNIIGFIVILFFICHLPLRVAGLWFTFEDKHVIYQLGLERYLILLFSTRIMFYMNHAFNPIVYNLVSTKFRSALKALYFQRARHTRKFSGTISRKRSQALSNKSGSIREHADSHQNKYVKNNTFPMTIFSSKQRRHDCSVTKDKTLNKTDEEKMEQISSETPRVQEINENGLAVSVKFREEKVAVVFHFESAVSRKNTVVLSTRPPIQHDSVKTRVQKHR